MTESIMQMELDDMQRKKNDEVQSNRADSSGSADQAVQITPDIDMIAPDWFTKKMNTEEIMIDRVQKDGAIAVIGCTVYFNARRYKGGRLVARIGDYVVKDSVGRLNVVRKNDFDRLYKKEEA